MRSATALSRQQSALAGQAYMDFVQCMHAVFRPRKKWRARAARLARTIPAGPTKFVFPPQSMIFRAERANYFYL
jgi:hypothetical protein